MISMCNFKANVNDYDTCLWREGFEKKLNLLDKCVSE